MNHLPFDKPGKFWKGNLHTHSTRSDGRLSPEETCQRYREAGYDFIALTDHFMDKYNYPITDTQSFRTDNFTTIIGAELHTGMTMMDIVWHILAVGLPFDFAPSASHETGPQLAERAMQAGAYVAVAHPNWYALTEADALSLGAVHAIEIFNGIAIDANDRADSWHIADSLLGQGHRYFTCATDDCHFNPLYHDFQRGWVHVKSESLEPEALLAALKAGHNYSSTGPEIHDIQIIPGEKARIRCSPVNSIFMTGKASTGVRLHGQGLTEAELDLKGFKSPYGRVTVRDAHGRRAWSNPIWF